MILVTVLAMELRQKETYQNVGRRIPGLGFILIILVCLTSRIGQTDQSVWRPE